MTRDALLAAIIADPSDDLLRLKYADLCGDLGDTDRAAAIQKQVEDSRYGVGDTVFTSQHAGLSLGWHRGFINCVTCTTEAWFKEAANIVPVNPPIELVTLTTPVVPKPGLTPLAYLTSVWGDKGDHKGHVKKFTQRQAQAMPLGEAAAICEAQRDVEGWMRAARIFMYRGDVRPDVIEVGREFYYLLIQEVEERADVLGLDLAIPSEGLMFMRIPVRPRESIGDMMCRAGRNRPVGA